MTDEAATATQVLLPADKRRAKVRALAGLVLLAGLVFWALSAIDFQEFGRVLAAAVWPPLGWACVLALFVCMPACALRLWLLLLPLSPPGRPIRYRRLLAVYIASSAAHHVLPSPLAEVGRIVYLRRRDGFDLGAVLSAQLVEKIIDVLGLALLTFTVALFAPFPLPLVGAVRWTGLVALLAVALLVLLVWRFGGTVQKEPDLAQGGGFWARRKHATARLLRQLAAAFYTLRHPPRLVLSLAASLANELGNSATVFLCARAVGVELGAAAVFALVLAARFAGLLPSTPGQFGVVEAGVVLVLSGFGVPAPQALAIGLLYHLVHFVPVTLAGLGQIRRLV